MIKQLINLLLYYFNVIKDSIFPQNNPVEEPNNELLSNIEGMTDVISEDKMDKMSENYQKHMWELYGKVVKPGKIPEPTTRCGRVIPEVKVGEVDPRVAQT